ncbi:MAG: hypothetical protein FWD81_01005 [Methanomassiliicoccaceae archaeon]|nr:hypothetical protein [Methanomassiliicoccaceae archaeon]
MFRLFSKKDGGKVAGTLAVGCGGGGCNIANRLGGISGVDILTVNTDRKGLVRSRSNRRILLGDGSMDAGCGGDVALGRSLTTASSAMIDESIRMFLNVAILAGLGGGTGTGAAEVIASAARRNGSRVILFATIPMSFEFDRRKVAIDALDGLAAVCDIMVVLDGDRLVSIDPMLGAREAFSVLDQMICESFMSLMDMLESADGEHVFRMMKGRTFSVSFAEGMSVEKVAAALASGLMTSFTSTSNPIIFVRGNIPQDGSERIMSDMIAESVGNEPVFIQGPGGRGMNLVMFTPIQ